MSVFTINLKKLDSLFPSIKERDKIQKQVDFIFININWLARHKISSGATLADGHLTYQLSAPCNSMTPNLTIKTCWMILDEGRDIQGDPEKGGLDWPCYSLIHFPWKVGTIVQRKWKRETEIQKYDSISVFVKVLFPGLRVCRKC